MALAACGGQSFVFDSEAGTDASTTPSSADGSAVDMLIPCPGMTCAVGGTCCTVAATSTNTTCTQANGKCNDCSTSLTCGRDTNCPDLGQCCIGPVASATTCSGGSQAFASICRSVLAGCMAGEARLCNPNLLSTCPTKFTCSSNASDLQKWGLPAGTSDYGVCVAN